MSLHCFSCFILSYKFRFFSTSSFVRSAAFLTFRKSRLGHIAQHTRREGKIAVEASGHALCCSLEPFAPELYTNSILHIYRYTARCGPAQGVEDLVSSRNGKVHRSHKTMHSLMNTKNRSNHC